MSETHTREWVYPFGSNADVDAAAVEDVWPGGGAYAWPAAAGAATVVSGSAADAAAGTGARTVEVVGLSSGHVVQRETVTLTGTDAVTLGLAYLRVLDVRVKSAGSGGVNAGALTLTIGGATAGVVPAGAGRLNGCLYTVPADRCAYLSGARLGAGAATPGYLTGSLLVRPWGEAWQTVGLVEVGSGVSGTQTLDTANGTIALAGSRSAELEFEGMLYLPPKADVRLAVAASTNNMVAMGALALMLGPAY